MSRSSQLIWSTAFLLLLLGRPTTAEETTPDPLKLYGFCMKLPPAQAKVLDELGFDGVGYPLWFGEELDKNLRSLDEAEVELCLVYMNVNVNPDKPAFDARASESFAKLDGRDVTVSVLLGGLPPGDSRGMEGAVKVLRELGDLAAESNLRISIYNHVNNWTESLLFSLEVVKKVDRPNVGVNFNLCHWLKVDGDKDYRPVLRENADRIFAVTINGAQCDATAWTGGLIQPLDRGDFDNRELVGILREIGYRGPVGLMCYGITDDTREHLGRSMQAWKAWQKP